MAPEWLVTLRDAHIACAMVSGSLFALRGAATFRGAAWPQASLARRGSMLVDSLLLAFGVALVIATHQYPFAVNWLTVKLALIVAYIVLGVFAMTRGRAPALRLACYALAILTYLMIVSVAVTHHPAGFLAMFHG
jgi:uncharacterized membrane protein SirB2